MSSAKSRVLVVDDTEMNRDVLSRQLTRQGHETYLVGSGPEALEALRTESFDLVLLDIMMPGMDGYQVLETVKSDAALKDLPVVMISALNDTDSIVRCIELGAEDYLPKPFHPSILKARVNASLMKKHVRDRERRLAESLERELSIAHDIQQSFLPETLPAVPGYEIAALFEPARQVAGDFYDVFPLPDGSLALVVADVCGKGVGAALFMALFRSLLRAGLTSRCETEPAHQALLRTVETTNDYIAETHGSANMFATTFFAVLSPATGELTYVNAGHERPIIVGSVLRHLETTGPAMGLMAGPGFQTRRITLDPGETLVSVTDGVTEAKGPSGFYGEERLLQILRPGRSAADVAGDVKAALDVHVAGEDPHDDVTLLVLRRTA